METEDTNILLLQETQGDTFHAPSDLIMGFNHHNSARRSGFYCANEEMEFKPCIPGSLLVSGRAEV